MFLNTTPTVTNWTNENKQFSLIFDENPLADFVELPDDGRAQDELWYSNILCGVLRGALEMVRRFPCQSRDHRCGREPSPRLHWLTAGIRRYKSRWRPTSSAIPYGDMTIQRCGCLW